MIHSGIYKGPVILTHSGSKNQPIIYKSAGDGPVEIIGKDDAVIINEVNHIVLQNLKIVANRQGIFLDRANFIKILGCHIKTQDKVIEIRTRQQRGCIFMDNIIEGPKRLFGGAPKKGIDTQMGILMRGPYHIAAYNLIRDFGDGIKAIDGKEIDIYGNDISKITDDAIEPDYSNGNIRIWKNRIRHAFVGISLAPVGPGPTYCFRNEIFNVAYTPFKMNNSPCDIFLFHNTVLKSGSAFTCGSGWKKVQTRNNIFFGTRYALELYAKNNEDFDFEGLGSIDYGVPIKWNGKRYSTINQFCESLKIECNGINLGTNPQKIFSNPKLPSNWYTVGEADLKLKSGSVAVDAGTIIPSINDNYKGSAPDLGAYELGIDSLKIGPRYHF